MTNIGYEIKKRREELGMSQDELAIKMGYKSRSTIAKIEKGVNDVVQSNIVKFAEVLHTTPSHLMGWDNSPEQTQNIIQYTRLSIATELFESLSDIGQEMAIENMKLLKKVHPRKDELLLNAAHERTDIEVTDEMRKHDEDIMDDENF